MSTTRASHSTPLLLALWLMDGSKKTHLSARDRHLNLAARRRHELGELSTDARKEAEAVVLGQRFEEVLDRLVGTACQLGQFTDDERLVRGRQCGRRQDLQQLGIFFYHVAQVGDGAGRRVECRRLGCGRVLGGPVGQRTATSRHLVPPLARFHPP